MDGSTDWETIRGSLKRLGEAFAELVAGAPEPGAAAVGAWSVADTAAHVLGVVHLDLALLAPADPPEGTLPDLPERIAGLNVDGINGLNEAVLATLEQRDPAVLAERLRTGLAELLHVTEHLEPDLTLTWVGGSTLPLAGLLSHLHNELLLHGLDIARVTGAAWPMSAADAAPFFEHFIGGLAAHGVGVLLDGGGRPRRRRITVEFRSAFTTPVTLVLHHGRVSAQPPHGRPDVLLTFDPLTMTLMMFGRIGKARAVASRGVRIGGRRPWLLPVFLQTFRVPG